ncbi:BnaCnng73300D [Brassica napus]|uniref:BnaCnng73300D protein n=1 Tax=Brassica napus TaxID=3708 RepID=A0A078JVC4_BRANA|nr:BnaCnng73300D [Brassica napus]
MLAKKHFSKGFSVFFKGKSMMRRRE